MNSSEIGDFLVTSKQLQLGMQQKLPQTGVDLVMNRCKCLFGVFRRLDIQGEFTNIWLCTCTKSTEVEAHNRHHLTITQCRNSFY